MKVSRSTGRAIQKSFEQTWVGLIIAVLDVPHMHVVPMVSIDAIADVEFNSTARNPDSAKLD